MCTGIADPFRKNLSAKLRKRSTNGLVIAISIVVNVGAIITKTRPHVAELDVRKRRFKDVNELHGVLIRQNQFGLHFSREKLLSFIVKTLHLLKKEEAKR